MTVAMSEQVGISKQRGFRLRCFLGRRLGSRLVILFFCVISSAIGRGQLVEVPCKGTVSECAAKSEEYCANAEDTRANLKVPQEARVWGVMIDSSGAVIAHPESGLAVELRDPKTSKVLVLNHLSEMGTFDLGKVAAGSYRLIAVVIVDGKTTRFRGWDQPRGLACGLTDECTLAMLLRPHGTDQRIEFCPPK
jgi:hypothetical protein